ncbi:pilus assembly protein [Rhodoferax sp.]|jgi:type IV pilus assembly protein PilX|uniref:pilus assembly protein n=1 Tax=Rhodoferax sp. TaxID=50421 RepID=UPI003783B0EE
MASPIECQLRCIQLPVRPGGQCRGAALVGVLLVLVLVELLGVAAVQLALMGERSARSHRDTELALQAAEAALADAELDITRFRAHLFDGIRTAGFAPGCARTSEFKGLCAPSAGAKPVWLDVDLEDADGPAVAYGEQTGRSYAQGAAGIQPLRSPRYIIEWLPDTSGTPGSEVVYRVTAIGFGSRTEVQVVLQMLYRI